MNLPNEHVQVEYENHLDPRVITDDKIERRFRVCFIMIPVLRSLWFDDISSFDSDIESCVVLE